MTLNPVSFALVALLAVLPAFGATAETAAETASAEAAATLSATAETAAKTAAESSAKPGILGLLSGAQNPSRAAEKAERRAERHAQRLAERQVKRDERKLRKDNTGAASASAPSEARVEVKSAVAVAIANRPKGRLWCVPFARAVSGVDIRGNAKTWWAQAAGVYQRGHEPQVGAVMAFAASGSMPKGHVAVVSQVVSDREILVDQANWERNRVTQDTLVVDVSEKGDWTRVKVANGAGTMGRVNPVSGFIYN